VPPAVNAFRKRLARTYERFARRRRRRRGALASGAKSPLGASAYRSIRTTGRMMTAADSDLSAIGLDRRALGRASGKLITVPISLPPSPDGWTPQSGSCAI
jgi:hypothetical protein